MFYKFDANGAIIQVSAGISVDEDEDSYVEVTEAIPRAMIDPRYLNGRWVEGASLDERKRAVDRETFELIKNWCTHRDRDKCEEYYLNRGIADPDDSEYQHYVSEKDNIKRLQKIKREALEE